MSSPLVISMIFVFFLYVLYVLTMGFARNLERTGGMRWWQWVIAIPIIIAGFVIDIFVNLTIASAIFLDPPRELTLTDRLNG